MTFPTQIIISQLTISVIIYSLIASYYVWPRLKKMQLQDALIPLLFLQAFRYLGLMFLLPQATGGSMLAPEFAIPTAYGDLATGILSIITIIALRKRMPIGMPLVWIVGLIGTVDFLYGYYTGIRLQVPLGGASYFVPVLFNPAMFVSLFMIFKLLISKHRIKRVID